MLSNLETEKSKLIQIALIGQPNLRDLLQRPELEQLRQRVTVSYHLQALDSAETAAYVNHRLQQGGDRRAARVLARRHRPDSPAQRGTAAEDQRHLRRRAALRLRRGAADRFRWTSRRKRSRSWNRPASSSQPTGRVQSDRWRRRRARRPRSHEEELAAREARLAERERQIAEQQRVINEEYRLLKLRSERAIADPPLHGDWAWPPVAPKSAETPRPAAVSARRRIRRWPRRCSTFRRRRRSSAS